MIQVDFLYGDEVVLSSASDFPDPDVWPKFRFQEFNDWYSPASVRSNPTARPRGEGAFPPGKVFRDSKIMGYRMILESVDGQTMLGEDIDLFNGLMPDGEAFTCRVTDDAGVRTREVVIDGQAGVIPFTPRKARLQLPLRAYDPLKYGETRTSFTNYPNPGNAGLRFPLFTPDGTLNFGGIGALGRASASNNGTAETWPKYRVTTETGTGGFEIREISGTAGRRLLYNAPLAPGDEIWIDSKTGRVTYRGQSDLTRNLDVAEWFPVPPKGTLTVQFNPVGVTDTTTRLALESSDAWR